MGTQKYHGAEEEEYEDEPLRPPRRARVACPEAAATVEVCGRQVVDEMLER